LSSFHLSLPDALPIFERVSGSSRRERAADGAKSRRRLAALAPGAGGHERNRPPVLAGRGARVFGQPRKSNRLETSHMDRDAVLRSEEHTSELQSRENL